MVGDPGQPLPARPILPGGWDGGNDSNISYTDVFQRHGKWFHSLGGILKVSCPLIYSLVVGV